MKPKLLLVNAKSGPDYLADIFLGEMIYSEKYEIYANFLPDYMFDDYPAALQLYGQGYTVFTKLAAGLKESVTCVLPEKLPQMIENRYFDIVVFTSIWRQMDYLQNVIENYNPKKIIALDGEDHQSILNLSDKLTYYKRELVSQYGEICRPISFAYPDYFDGNFIGDVQKTIFLAPCFAGFTASYVFNSESSYYEQYRRSFFGITTKKAGWDCMRHYEIVKSSAIPYFPDILQKPTLTMYSYPVQLQCRANSLFEECLRTPQNLDRLAITDLVELREGFAEWLNIEGSSKNYHRLVEVALS